MTELVASAPVLPEVPWTIIDISSAMGRHQPQLLELRLSLPDETTLDSPEVHSVSLAPYAKKQSVSLIVYR